MYEEIKEQMVDICHKLWQKGWVAANDGNVTVKVGEGKYPCDADRRQQGVHHSRKDRSY